MTQALVRPHSKQAKPDLSRDTRSRPTVAIIHIVIFKIIMLLSVSYTNISRFFNDVESVGQSLSIMQLAGTLRLLVTYDMRRTG